MADFVAILAEQFFVEDARRRESSQWDYGFFRAVDGNHGMLITWIEATGEVCALIGGGRYPKAFILLGTAPSYKAVEAALVDRPGPEASICWVVERLRHIPQDAEKLRSWLAGYGARVQEEAEEAERQDLASFEVVELSNLPETDEAEAERYREEEWQAIARIAVDLLEAGVSPHDDEAILARGRKELTSTGCGLLHSLFHDPIAIPQEASDFIDGRHRTAALRAAGVQRCVVHTDRGGR